MRAPGGGALAGRLGRCGRLRPLRSPLADGVGLDYSIWPGLGSSLSDLLGGVPARALLRWSILETGRAASGTRSVFAGFRFPCGVISVAVRWYLRYGLSCRNVEELLAERGVTVDHVTIFRWVQRFAPEFIEAARPCRRAPGDRWFADETYVKVAGQWTYLYRAVDQHGQVIDVLVSARRDLGRAAVLRPGAAGGHGPGGGHDRPCARLPAGAR